MVGTVVQIGLEHTCEYHYFSYPDWKSRMSREDIIKRIPDCFNYERYRYVGIDMDPKSIVHCSRRYSDNFPTFINTEIKSIQDLKDTVADISIEQIDVLAVDIEGTEKYLFERGWYKESLPIRFIAVEFHPQFGMLKTKEGSLHYFTESIQEAGYSLCYEGITNRESRHGITVEQHWLKK